MIFTWKRRNFVSYILKWKGDPGLFPATPLLS